MAKVHRQIIHLHQRLGRAIEELGRSGGLLEQAGSRFVRGAGLGIPSQLPKSRALFPLFGYKILVETSHMLEYFISTYGLDSNSRRGPGKAEAKAALRLLKESRNLTQSACRMLRMAFPEFTLLALFAVGAGYLFNRMEGPQNLSLV